MMIDSSNYASELVLFFLFFFNDTATTEIYTLSLHDALPICRRAQSALTYSYPSTPAGLANHLPGRFLFRTASRDRKSTRLNSSHANISYAVFCLKKKKKKINEHNSILITNEANLFTIIIECL